MERFKINVQLTHKFEYTEDLEIEVDADTAEEARKLARAKAFEDSDPEPYDAEHESTRIDKLEIVDRAKIAIPRCDKTSDMFAA